MRMKTKEQLRKKAKLPPSLFFNPTNNFLDWAEQNLKGHPLIDCGAGIGRLSKLLKDRHLNILPIDLYARDNPEATVLIMDSTSFNFPKNSIAIIARPNRGDWIEDTINHALKTCSFVLYIGIQEHIEEDIESLKNLKVEKVFEEAGDDEEIVYKISKEKTNMKTTYCLVSMHPCEDPKIVKTSWYEDADGKWVNYMGGWCPKSDNDIVVETQEAEDIHDLNWLKTSLINDKETSGWLDRSGRFYGCNTQAHDLVADLVFNKSVKEMEDEGWVRIYDEIAFACMKSMSPEQRNYMLEKGYKLVDSD